MNNQKEVDNIVKIIKKSQKKYGKDYISLDRKMIVNNKMHLDKYAATRIDKIPVFIKDIRL